jgi:hypothetical protein
VPKPSPGSCLLNLRELMVTNLSRADGPWEPSVVLGDELLAGIAVGCPNLRTLEVRGCLWRRGGGEGPTVGLSGVLPECVTWCES